ncbi:O-antigen ligase [Shewanella sp. GutCb]|uniref:O-antigen ligase family protein n=1 Tax=Shewanella sp. GutCb TaxID=2058315 RepID=UPI0015E144AC|nr:O-antigen ligase family protein [Shewanella sp. GutCb]
MKKRLSRNFTKIAPSSIFNTMLIIMVIAVTLLGGSAPFIVAFTISELELIYIAVFILIKKKRSFIHLKIIPREMFIILILLTITILISTLLNHESDNDNRTTIVMFSVIFKMLHLAFFAALTSTISCCRKVKTDTLIFIPITITLIAFIFLIMGIFSFPSALIENTLTVPFSSNRRYLGYICTAGVAISVVLFTQQIKLNSRLLFLASLVVVNTTLLIWLGGRASIISVFVTILIYYTYLYQLHILDKKRLFILALLLFLSISLSYQLSIFEWNGPGRFMVSQMSLVDEDSVNSFSSNRIVIWKQTIDAILERPLFGFGPEGYRFHPEHRFGLHPHNSILQILVTYGVISGFLFAILFLKLLHMCKLQIYDLKNRYKNESVLATSVILSLSIHSVFDGTFYHAQPLFFLTLTSSIIIAINLKNRKYLIK